MDIQRVPIPVSAPVPRGRTNAYVAGSGGSLVVIDPAGASDRIDDAIEGARSLHVAVTHAHADHVGGVEHYAREFDSVVWSRARHRDRFRNATGVGPDRAFSPGDSVGPLQAIATPGHAPDHTVFAVGDAAIAGDVVIAEGSVFVGGDDGDMRSYMTTLRRLLARRYRVMYPGHGPVIRDPAGVIARLVRHRNRREARILEAVREGARTPGAVRAAAYDQDLSGREWMADASIRAHLAKLAVEGEVVWDGERAAPE